MKFYDFLTQVIGNDSVMKGRGFPPYLLNLLDSYEEPKGFVHIFDVESASSDNSYDVEIKNNGEEFYDAKCTCPQFKRTNTCKHIAACLMYYRFEMMSYKKIDILKASKEILDMFYEPNKPLKIKEKLNLEIGLEFYENELKYKLYIGTTKLYTINNYSKLNNFLECYFNGGTYKFGAKLIYNPDDYYFSDEDKDIIDYLSSIERRHYSNLELNERDLKYVFEKVSINKLKINGNNIKAIKHEMPTNFSLEKNKKGYELTISNLDKYRFLTSSLKNVLYENTLYIIPEDERKIIIAFANHELTSIIFTKKDIGRFSKGLLGKIKNKIDVSEDITDIQINLKPEGKIYLDIGSSLTCKIKLKYGSDEIDFFEDSKEIIRDNEYENELIQDIVNNGFKLENKKIKMDDIDTIGYFLEEGINSLKSKYEIYTSKKIDSTNLIKKSRITKDFSIGTNGIMSFNFEIDNIDEEELKNIFNSLENKKTYHKLKNGNIINLESDNELQELNSLFSDLDINKNNITTNIEIPKYRALYIDSLRNNKYQDITTNNSFEDFIKNFKEYQNIKINLSKEDNKILRDYQKIGVRWMFALYKCDLGGILADEMGLGKSIQTICFIKEVLKEKKDAKILIVCPTSLVYNWEKEFAKFGSDLKYTTISETKTKRVSLISNDNYNIFITSYGLLRNDIEEYKKQDYEICIIDEAQFIKNYQAKMTIALKEINSHTKLALTGTPLENSITELWSIFDFLMPGYLNSVKKFHEKYHISDVTKEDLEKLESLNYQIKPFILRRKKNEVSKDLPEKIENTIYLDLPESQKKLYLSVLKETEREINEEIESVGYKAAQFKILTLLTKLREICINPYVLYENYDGEAIKIEKIIEMIKDYAKEEHKILIFSSFKRVLDLLKERLNKEHISFYSIDGSVKGKERLPLVDKFNEDDTTCFLITLKSGGTGLNLTSADIVIHLDIWWNPQAENQATDRAHRIGQIKNVIVNKLITKGTIEERILDLQNKKKILSDNLIEGHSNGEMLSSLTETEVRELLSYSND